MAKTDKVSLDNFGSPMGGYPFSPDKVSLNNSFLRSGSCSHLTHRKMCP